MSKQSFADLGVSAATAAALARQGAEHPFAVQQLVLPDALAGHDLLVESPTGTGKTLAFGVPMLERTDANGPRPAALVLAPTRELASQIVDELHGPAHARALRVKAVYGGVGIVKQEREAAKAHVVVATPGRLMDLLQRGSLTLKHVQTLVLDEADRMLDMGFRPAVERIVKQLPRDRQTLLFSATLDGSVADLAARYTREPRQHTHKPATEKKGHVEHRFVRVAHEEKLARLVHELEQAPDALALVFVRTKRGADRLVKRLSHHGVEAVAMHGDKSQRQRERALARFEAGEVRTLVATDVAARGIDVRDVSHVINFDAPADREDYVHRVGRTARAGRDGIGITLVMDDQGADVHKIASSLGLEREFAHTGLAPKAAAPRGGGTQTRTGGGQARSGAGSSRPGGGSRRRRGRR
ncbi:DEAD/DEAH box helicase [Conexibacter sp. SYSU D00693]|uniref:DEAD/DEAH box helicase n=1 Tax=Conexibacter sp. SYSU D00693 TaxID=2812560 RepID=UPI00196AFFE8|nr:DEAD/DEAH box helicase [Conexibacter sp. SYSU D00693]